MKIHSRSKIALHHDPTLPKIFMTPYIQEFHLNCSSIIVIVIVGGAVLSP
jgi:hypothetical protein